MQGYKNSGIEWIGEIPDHWRIKRLKYLIKCLDGKRIPLEASLREDGQYPYWGAGSIQGYINDYIFDEEIVLLGEDGAPFFDRYRPVAFYITGKVWVNNHIHVLKGIKINSKYLTYYLNIVEYDLYINGSILNKLTQSNMNNIAVILPSEKEQQQIADFLDKKCSEIDSVIEKIEKQIYLLKDYKNSLITESVTKGLNKNVPMKDSGIEWIGEIPKHWMVNRLRYLVDFKTGGTPSEKFGIDSEGDYPWITASDISSYYIKNFQQYISEEAISLCNYKIFPENTILIVCIASIGKIGISKCKSYSNQQITALYNALCNERFLLYSIIQQIDKIRLDASSSVVPIINTSYLKDVYIVMPQEIKEQIEIADFLDKKCSEIDSIISKKERQLDLIREHRKSLIYEYVTGKKRVGGVKDGN